MTDTARPPIHSTNAWNPTGQMLAPVPGTRLYYVHATRLGAARTFVLLGDQHHLTFVADIADHVPPDTLRQTMLDESGVYPHQVDLPLDASLPTPVEDEPRGR